MNSATILIADRRGRQEIARAIRGLPSSVRSPIAPGRPEAGNGSAATTDKRSVLETARRSLKQAAGFAARHWVQILIVPVVGTLVWFLSTLK